jgi:hypothetical protein
VTEYELAEIRARAESATSGRWINDNGCRVTTWRAGRVITLAEVQLMEGYPEAPSPADVAFIAAARQDVLVLISALEERARRERITRPPCDVCAGPTEGRAACVSISANRALSRLHRRKRRELTAAGGQSLLQKLGETEPDDQPVAWLWAHSPCVPEENDYEISARDISTHSLALGWTVILSCKSWFDPGAWAEIMRRLFELPSL